MTYQDIRSIMNKYNNNQGKEVTFNNAFETVPETSLDSGAAVSNYDVAQEFMSNNPTVNNASINGGIDVYGRDANGGLTIDTLKYDTVFQNTPTDAKVNLLQSELLQENNRKITELEHKKNFTQDDQTLIDQLVNEQISPNNAALMKMQGFDPNKAHQHYKVNENLPNPMKDFINYLEKQKVELNFDKNAANRPGTVYILYNPQTNQSKIGFAKTNKEERYINQDIQKNGWQLVKQYRVKDAAAIERKLHILEASHNLTTGTVAYDLHGNPMLNTSVANSFRSGRTEIIDGKVFSNVNGTNTPEEIFNRSVDRLRQQNIIKLSKMSEGRNADMLHAFYSGAVNAAGGAIEGTSKIIDDAVNGALNWLDGNKNYIYIRRGILQNYGKYLRTHADKIGNYSTKDVRQAGKDFDEGIAKLSSGDIIGGLYNLISTFKAAPQMLAQSLPSMVQLGIPYVGIASYAAGQYANISDNYLKNNNYKPMSGSEKTALLGASVVDALLQKSMLKYIIGKDGKLILADKDLLTPVADFDHIAKVAPDIAKKTLKGLIAKMISKGAISFGKGAIAEAPPEIAEQLMNDVWSKYNTDRYKGESIEQLIKDSAMDAAKAGWFGAMLGGPIHSATHVKEWIGKPIKEYNKAMDQREKQQTIKMTQYLPDQHKVDIYNKSDEELNNLNTSYNILQEHANNKPNKLSDISSILTKQSGPNENKHITIGNDLTKETYTNAILSKADDIINTLKTNNIDGSEKLVNDYTELLNKYNTLNKELSTKTPKLNEDNSVKEQELNQVKDDLAKVLGKMLNTVAGSKVSINTKQNILNDIHKSFVNEVQSNVIPKYKNKIDLLNEYKKNTVDAYNKSIPNEPNKKPVKLDYKHRNIINTLLNKVSKLVDFKGKEQGITENKIINKVTAKDKNKLNEIIKNKNNELTTLKKELINKKNDVYGKKYINKKIKEKEQEIKDLKTNSLKYSDEDLINRLNNYLKDIDNLINNPKTPKAKKVRASRYKQDIQNTIDKLKKNNMYMQEASIIEPKKINVNEKQTTDNSTNNNIQKESEINIEPKKAKSKIEVVDTEKKEIISNDVNNEVEYKEITGSDILKQLDDKFGEETGYDKINEIISEINKDKSNYLKVLGDNQIQIINQSVDETIVYYTNFIKTMLSNIDDPKYKDNFIKLKVALMTLQYINNDIIRGKQIEGCK
jgi:hypothetical protein